MSRPASPAMAYQRPGLWALRYGPDVGREVVLPERRAAPGVTCARVRITGPGRPGRPNSARAPGRSRSRCTSRRASRCARVGHLDVIAVFPVARSRVEAAAAGLEDRAAAGGRSRRRPRSFGHLLAGAQGGQVERAEPGDLAEPGGVQRVVLRAFQDARRRRRPGRSGIAGPA